MPNLFILLNALPSQIPILIHTFIYQYLKNTLKTPQQLPHILLRLKQTNLLLLQYNKLHFLTNLIRINSMRCNLILIIYLRPLRSWMMTSICLTRRWILLPIFCIIIDVVVVVFVFGGWWWHRVYCYTLL